MSAVSATPRPGLPLNPARLEVVVGERPTASTCPSCGRWIPATAPGEPVVELELDNGGIPCHPCARRAASGLYRASQLADFVLRARRRGHPDMARQALLALHDALSLIDEFEAEQTAQGRAAT